MPKLVKDEPCRTTYLSLGTLSVCLSAPLRAVALKPDIRRGRNTPADERSARTDSGCKSGTDAHAALAFGAGFALARGALTTAFIERRGCGLSKSRKLS